MNQQCEVLDTFTSALAAPDSSKTFTDKEGKIFFLDYKDKVFFFDPFGEKQLTEHRDLQSYEPLSSSSSSERDIDDFF